MHQRIGGWLGDYRLSPTLSLLPACDKQGHGQVFALSFKIKGFYAILSALWFFRHTNHESRLRALPSP